MLEGVLLSLDWMIHLPFALCALLTWIVHAQMLTFEYSMPVALLLALLETLQIII